ncbi:uncharacterized protein LOC126484952 [Schistocerca serialis cubense]|uniref:uncharacterized protein LOC126484952 n=1 Tax=Schistocerca serialis cubense TaxID=2023355 RepID=UPI00214E9B06|nr:uncharacterized protein LOC126484952 [Schistocerca serialis cubense]
MPAIAAMVKHLKWNHVMVVHGTDDYSKNVLHTFISLTTMSDDFCIVSAQEYHTAPQTGNSDIDRQTVTKNQQLYGSMLSVLKLQLPVVVLMSFSDYYSFLKDFHTYLHSGNLSHVIDSKQKKNKFIFSDLLTHEDLSLINETSFDVYSVTLLPDYVPAFEDYWENRKAHVKNLSQTRTQKDRWLFQYLQQIHNTTEDSLHIALRTRAVLSSSYTVLVFAQALEQAWKSACFNKNDDFCPEMMDLGRNVFLENYFEPVLKNSAVFNQSETEEEQRKFHTFVLVKYQNSLQKNDSVELTKVMLFNSASGAHLVNEEILPNLIVACPVDENGEQDCSICSQIRLDRGDSGRHYSVYAQNVHKVEARKLVTQTYMEEKDYTILLKSQNNMYIAFVLPVHNGTDADSLIQCRQDAPVDTEAVRQLEAFLWALQKVNGNLKKTLGGNIEIGAILLDTCNSRVRMMTLAAGLETFSNKITGQHSHKVIAAINGLRSPDGKVLDEILSSLNITSISVSQSSTFKTVDTNRGAFILQHKISWVLWLNLYTVFTKPLLSYYSHHETSFSLLHIYYSLMLISPFEFLQQNYMIYITKDYEGTWQLFSMYSYSPNNQPCVYIDLKTMVAPELTALTTAVMKMLEHFGWTYISVVYSEAKEEYEFMFQHLQKTAAQSGVCFALEEGLKTTEQFPTSYTASIIAFSAGIYLMLIDLPNILSLSGEQIKSGCSCVLNLCCQNMTEVSNLVRLLVESRASGARGVLLLLSPNDLQLLMQSVGQALGHGTLRREDLFWLVVNVDGEAQHILEQYRNFLSGVLTFGPQKRPVREFLQHLWQLQLGSRRSEKNPWLHKYYQKVSHCNDAKCKHLVEVGSYTDFNVIQAVYAIGKAFQNMANDMCFVMFNSTCMENIERSPLTLNQYLRSTTSERADGIHSSLFQFNENGGGNVPIEIFNLKRSIHEWSHTSADVHYERVALFSNSSLNLLDDVYTYRDMGSEVVVSSLTSQCATRTSCSQCRGHHRKLETAEWVRTIALRQQEKTKNTKFYVAAAFDIHEASINPMECGSELHEKGIEQLEAFLWAIEQVNKNSTYINLAAVSLDSCGSPVKAAQDIADLLTLHTSLNRNGASQNSAVAFIVGGGTNLVSAVMDSVNYLKIPVFASEARGPLPHRKKYAPYPLQLAPTSKAYAAAVLALLQNLSWSCFSVIYLQDGIEYEDSYRLFVDYASVYENGLNMTISLPVPLQYTAGIIREYLKEIATVHTSGNKIVVLLLPNEVVELLLRVLQAMEDESQIAVGALTFIVLGAEKALNTYSEQALGTLVIRPAASHVLEFETYFRHHNLSTNTHNPWFAQFWSTVFHCRGANCHNKLYKDLQSYHFKASTSVANTINSVLSIAHALGAVARELCPETILSGQHCSAMQDIDRVRHRLFEVAPHMAFVGAGLNTVAFSKMGENTHAETEVLSFQRNNNGHYILVPVGRIDAKGNVKVNETSIKLYSMKRRDEVSVYKIQSPCEIVHDGINTVYKPILKKVPANKNLSILGIIPLHEEGEGQFNCGKLQLNAALHAGAILYKLEQINNNASLLPGNVLGVTIVDSCFQPSYVYGTAFNTVTKSVGDFWTDNKLGTASNRGSDIIAAITNDVQSSENIQSLLKSNGITHITVPMDKYTLEGIDLHNAKFWEEVLQHKDAAEAMLSAAMAMRSHSVVIVREAEEWAETASEHIQNHDWIKEGVLCLSGVYSLYNRNTEGLVGAISSSNMMVTEEITKKLRPGTTIILLLQDPREVQSFLNVCHTIDGLIFMTVIQNNQKQIQAGFHNIVTLKPLLHQTVEESEIQNFKEWLKQRFIGYGPNAMYSMPKPWVDELKESYGSLIIGDQLNISSPSIWDTMESVSIIATAMNNVLENHCSNISGTVSLEKCGIDYNDIFRLLEEEVLSAIHNNCELRGFSLWNGHHYIGTWNNNSGFKLISPVNFSTLLSDCTSVQCSVCMEETELEKSFHEQPTVYHNFQYTWPIAIGGMTLLGIIATVLISLYFLGFSSPFSATVACHTSALDYFMLLGILLLFTSNFTFILSPTSAVCGLRRIFPGFSYTIIFSAMLLKASSIWRENTRKKFTEDWLFCSSGLIIMAVILTVIQVILSGVWLLLIPPQPYLTTETGINFWKCYPSGNFHAHLLISLIYVILLLIMAAVVSLISCFSFRKESCSEDERSKEARGILAASILTAAVFTFWGISTITAVSPQNSDLATATAHLISAYLLLLSLELSKFLPYMHDDSISSGPSNIRTVYDISDFHPTSIKGLPGFCSAAPTVQLDSTQQDDDILDDPSQIIPSSLYSLDMFSTTENRQLEDDDEEQGEHCEPGTNEFMPPASGIRGVEDRLSIQETLSYM